MAYRVTYRGTPGTYFDQPEAAELVGDCEYCGEETDFWSTDTPVPGAELTIECQNCRTEYQICLDDPDDDWRREE